MAALPSSDMPGHRVLHDRVTAALDTCVESQPVDFKQSAQWDAIEFKLVRTGMAMGNLRDGGIIIIGASEQGDSWDLAGITPEDLATYEVDAVIDGINRYASPPISASLVTVKYRNGNTFLAIEVQEFDETPFVCKKDGPPKSGLRRGMLCIRPAGLAQTTEIRNAEDMQDLLDLAAEKRARRIVELAHRVGFAAPSPSKPFEDELEGL
jgi:hypothetical protein